MNILRKIPVTFFVWITILSLVLVVMSPGLNGEFFYDDNPNIVDNVEIHIDTLTIASLKSSIESPAAGPLGRPVSMLSFALTHYFFGLDPFAFKAINLVIHAINGLLVAWFATLLLRTLRGPQLAGQGRTWLPLWVAAIWLIHPINILPVMLSVQRMTLLSGMFMLLALIGHLKGMSKPSGESAKWGWIMASWLVFWPLSILSKETGLLFPLYILTIAIFSRQETAARTQVHSWVIKAAVISLLGIVAAMLSFLGWDWLNGAYAMRPFTWSERLLTETRVLWFYAAQIVIPNYAAFGIYLDDFSLSTGILHPPQTLLAVIGWGGVILGIWRFRHRQPVLYFAAVWFLAGHSLESTLLPLEIAHEYRNYLPSFGLLLGVGYLGAVILQKIQLDYRSLTVGLTAMIPVLVLALFTWIRADQLGNPLVGSQVEATRHPQSARANYSAATALIRSGFGNADDPIGSHSIKYYLQQAGTVDSSFKSGYLGLVVWACASGRPVEKQWIDEFADRLEHTPLSPSDRDIPDNLLKPLLSMPKCLSRSDAIRLFMAGVGNSGANGPLKAKFFGAASDYELLVSIDPRSARDYLARASAVSPGDPGLRLKLKSYESVISASEHHK
ncbi:MAG: pilus assembly protein PilF [Nitrosomonadales bacterium]|nr:pilus assembly protein PilF [Nitrosomonadales bacterium]